MDVTFVLEESGATATVEVPCDANVAEAKRVACTEFAVSPASVEVRVDTEVVEGTCRLQDTAIGTGVQVVLACPAHADVRCPAEYRLDWGSGFTHVEQWTLSHCATLCVTVCSGPGSTPHVYGFDTESFETLFKFALPITKVYPPAISPCKTRCYMPCESSFYVIELPGGDVTDAVDVCSKSVFTCGALVVAKDTDGVSVYDEDLMLLRSLLHNKCSRMAASTCGKWLMTSSSHEMNARVWNIDTGLAVACVQTAGGYRTLAISSRKSIYAVNNGQAVRLHNWSATESRDFSADGDVTRMQFTPCGQYLVVQIMRDYDRDNKCEMFELHQYTVDTLSCVHVVPRSCGRSYAISPCSRVVMFQSPATVIVTRPLYPYISE